MGNTACINTIIFLHSGATKIIHPGKIIKLPHAASFGDYRNINIPEDIMGSFNSRREAHTRQVLFNTVC